MQAAIDAAVSGASSDVFAVNVSRGDDDSPQIDFEAAVAGSVTDAQIEAMFEELVARALDGTLMPSRDVAAGSVALGGSKQHCYISVHEYFL